MVIERMIDCTNPEGLNSPIALIQYDIHGMVCRIQSLRTKLRHWFLLFGGCGSYCLLEG